MLPPSQACPLAQLLTPFFFSGAFPCIGLSLFMRSYANNFVLLWFCTFHVINFPWTSKNFSQALDQHIRLRLRSLHSSWCTTADPLPYRTFPIHTYAFLYAFIFVTSLPNYLPPRGHVDLTVLNQKVLWSATLSTEHVSLQGAFPFFFLAGLPA